ncbi:MAG: 5-formyltetrahydrofolate cyclo-ligase [Planctomycetota bacterium]
MTRLAGDKATLRRELRSAVAALDEQQRHDASADIAARVVALPEWNRASVVMLYMALPSEVQTAALALRAWQDGKTVCLPRVDFEQRRMIAVTVASFSDDMDTVPGATGDGKQLLQPTAGQPMPLREIDLVLVPGLGFTCDGKRIGRGGGFYDRFLSSNDDAGGFFGTTLGVGFACQLVDDLPTQPHDIRLDLVATPNAVHRNCGEVL